MLSRLPAATVVLLLALALAAPAAAQPAAPDPQGEGEFGPAPEAAEEPDLAPGESPPASPEQAEERREDRLDTLFTRLAEAEGENWQRIQSDIWRLWSQSGSPSMDLLLRRAQEAMEAGQPELALRFLDDLVRLAPDFAEGWNKRATVHFRLGEYGRAVADIEHVLALEPRHFGALSGLAMILERLGNDQGAYQAYSEALEVHPNLPGAAEAIERLAPEVQGREL